MVSLDPILSNLQTTLLDDVKSSGTAPLDSTSLGTAGAGIIAQFTDLLGVSSIGVGNSPQITANTAQNTLTVSGTATASLLGIPTPAVSAVFSVVGQNLEIVLSITTGSGWSLADNFPMLSKTVLGQLTFAANPAPQFILCSQDGPSDVYGPILQTGLNLSLSLTLSSTSPAARLQALLPSVANPLPLAGPVSVASTKETLSLRGSGPNFSFKLPYFVAMPFSSAAPVLSGTSTIDEQ